MMGHAWAGIGAVVILSLSGCSGGDDPTADSVDESAIQALRQEQPYFEKYTDEQIIASAEGVCAQFAAEDYSLGGGNPLDADDSPDGAIRRFAAAEQCPEYNGDVEVVVAPTPSKASPSPTSESPSPEATETEATETEATETDSQPGILAFGETYQGRRGTITVSKPKPYQPSPDASTSRSDERWIITTIAVTNESNKVIDAYN